MAVFTVKNKLITQARRATYRQLNDMVKFDLAVDIYLDLYGKLGSPILL